MSSKRIPLRNSLRFSIFKRDLFICQYCGRTPPAVVLEVDHVQPRCEGGTDSEINLITSCFDCNRGKGRKNLDDVLPPISSRNEVIKERQTQIEQYEKLLRSQRRRQSKILDEVIRVYEEQTGRVGIPRRFSNSVRYHFAPKIAEGELISAMERSCARMSGLSEDRIFRYFCSICWKLIKEQELVKEPSP